MNVRTKLASNMAISMLSLVIVIGFLLHIFVIPILSQELEATYLEYRGDRLTIQFLLSGIVGFGQIALALVVYLLVRINRKLLLEPKSANAVRLLIGVFSALALGIACLLAWLIGQNTLPPALLIFLALSILLISTIALVVIALLAVLKEAIFNREELAGVI